MLQPVADSIGDDGGWLYRGVAEIEHPPP